MDALRPALRAIVAAQMDSDAGHDLAHLDRVWQTCQRISAFESQADQKVLLAAAYLHDLVNLPKTSPDRAKASGLSADAALPHLKALGFDAGRQQAVAHAIEAHSFSAGIAPTTVEARILRDADRLDAIGAIGIARTFMISGQMQTPLYDPDDPFAQNRQPDDGKWALDHWEIKLLRLSDGLCTDAAKTIAKERLAFMRLYLSQLSQELGF